MLALSMMAISSFVVVPVHAATLNNYVEGNWTSWTSYDKQDMTTFTASSGTPMDVKQTEDGASLLISIYARYFIYNINAKTISRFVIAPNDFCSSSGMGCALSAYGKYFVTADESTNKDATVYKDGVLIQTLTDATYGWTGSGAIPFAGFDQTGQWLVVLGRDTANSNRVTLWFFKGVGSAAPPPPLGGIIGNCQPGLCGPIVISPPLNVTKPIVSLPPVPGLTPEQSNLAWALLILLIIITSVYLFQKKNRDKVESELKGGGLSSSPLKGLRGYWGRKEVSGD